MIFESIKIENLFSYHGEHEFKFPAPVEGKPIILISGRNGYGKTSFINCVKLLFLGTNDEMMSQVQAGRKLRPPTYLLGLNREWQGVFNRKSRQSATSATRFGVSIRWKEDQGIVTAHRYWTLAGGENPDHHLHIKTDFETDLGRDITDIEHAEEFLERRLPKSIVSFFFYDGEQVQTIAEANREGQLKQMEKLLDIAAIDTLDEYLQRNISKWEKEGALAEQTQAEIADQQAKHQTCSAALQTLHVEHDSLIDGIEAIGREIKKHERARDALRIQSLQRDEPRLKEGLLQLRNEYEIACQDVANNLIPAAPLWASPALIGQVSEQLSAATQNRGHMLAEEIRLIMFDLQENIFDKPPHSSPALSPAQRKFYRSKLEKLCSVYTETPTSGFYSLPSAETLSLKKNIDYFTQATSERSRRVEELRRASLLRRKIIDTEAKLDNLTDISPDEQKAFQDRLKAIQVEQAKKDAAHKRIGAIEAEIQRTEDVRQKIDHLIKELETRLVKDSINTHRIKRARQAQKTFGAYKSKLKANRREQIEVAINKYFKTLMTSNSLISNIKIDGDFSYTLLTEDGNQIGTSNISFGMKQLIAHALMWAIKDVAHINAPIILDSPLGRMDIQHQKTILENLYPNIGSQVIILPTNSEINKSNYIGLKNKILTEYALENNTGESTIIRENFPMYASMEY